MTSAKRVAAPGEELYRRPGAGERAELIREGVVGADQQRPSCGLAKPRRVVAEGVIDRGAAVRGYGADAEAAMRATGGEREQRDGCRTVAEPAQAQRTGSLLGVRAGLFRLCVEDEQVDDGRTGGRGDRQGDGGVAGAGDRQDAAVERAGLDSVARARSGQDGGGVAEGDLLPTGAPTGWLKMSEELQA